MNGPNEFKAELKALGELVASRAEKLVRITGQALAAEMISGGAYSPGTPIRTGFHRSHWDADIDAPPAGGSVGGQEAPDPEAAEQRVLAVADTLEVGQTLFVTNNGPAIRRLEFDGWSPQAPNGFVQPAVEAIQPLVNEVAAHVLAEQ